MSVQTTLLVVMYLYYTNKALLAVLFLPFYAAIVYTLVSGLTPMAVLVKLVSLQVVFIVVSRVSGSQVWLHIAFFNCSMFSRSTTTQLALLVRA